ncbi:PAS domain S-box protein [Halobacillus seohaensis]|uniref:PAS domain S-box protein n=1 Tax=Halobacillus seohaensis TaxID=447421 RepID=A0ABW2EJ78_9BACI
MLITKLLTSVKYPGDKYWDIVKTSEDAMFVHGDENKIDYVNQSGICLLNASSSLELIGADIFQFVVDEEEEDIQERLGQIKADEFISRPINRCLKAVDGTKKKVEMHGGKVLYNGKVSIITVCRDITDKEYDEEEF